MATKEERDDLIIEMAFNKVKTENQFTDSGMDSNNHSSQMKRVRAEDLNFPGCVPFASVETAPKEELIARTTGSSSLNGNISHDDNLLLQHAFAAFQPNGHEVMMSFNNAPTIPLVQGELEIPHFTELPPAHNIVQPICDERTTVFLTYRYGDYTCLQIVHEIYQFLKCNGVEPFFDDDESLDMRMNINSWIDINVNRDFVLVCIDQGYTKYACSYPTNVDETDDLNRARTVAIFDRVQSKIRLDGSLHYRFIPILINGARMSHVPPSLQSTIPFRWPDKKNELLRRISKNYSRH